MKIIKRLNPETPQAMTSAPPNEWIYPELSTTEALSDKWDERVRIYHSLKGARTSNDACCKNTTRRARRTPQRATLFSHSESIFRAIILELGACEENTCKDMGSNNRQSGKSMANRADIKYLGL